MQKGNLCSPPMGKKVMQRRFDRNKRIMKNLGRIPIDPGIVEAEDSGRPFLLECPDSEAVKSFDLVLEKTEQSMKGM